MTMDVLALLKSKNRCLQRFLDFSLEYLASPSSGDTEKELASLESLQSRREAVIKTLDLYDRKIAEVLAETDVAKIEGALAEGIQASLEERVRLVENILGVDQKLVARIEDEKIRIQRELSSSRKNGDLVRKFKSAWVAESGEELDKKL